MNRIGILTALPVEARSFQRKRFRVGQTIHLNETIVLHIAGMGAESARIGAIALVEQEVSALVSWGTAGGLCPTVKPGHIVIPESVVDTNRSIYTTDPTWQKQVFSDLQKQIHVHGGALLQSSQVITSVASKRSLFQDYQALAVDMESAATATIAREAALPFIAIRAITDSAHVSLPHWLPQTLNAHGKVKPHTFLQKMLCAPHTWWSFLRVVRGFSAAKSALDTAARFMVEC